MTNCESTATPAITTTRVPAKGSAGNENSNSITLNFPSHGSLCNQLSTEKTQSQILVSPQPLKLSLENSTDWPPVIATFLVGIGSVMTTLLVGWLSAMNQRSQIRSNIATFRHKWLEDLREATSDFIALATRIHNELNDNPDYWETSQSTELFSQLVRLRAKIVLMLDAKKKYADELVELMNAAIEALRNHSEERINSSVNNLTEKAKEILELAWTDIKRDLQSQKWWR